MKDFVKANRAAVVFVLLVNLICIWLNEYIFYYKVFLSESNVKCIYDVIGIGLSWGFYKLLILFIPFVMVYFFKGCYRYGIIIRQVDLKKVWIKICVKLTSIVFVFSIYLTALICLIPFSFTNIVWNWSDKKSFVSVRCGVDTTYHPSMLLIIAGCFVAVFSMMMIVCLIMMFFWWVFESPVGGYIVAVLCTLEEIFNGILFISKVNMNPAYISRNGISVFFNFIYPMLLVVIVIVITYILFMKKDLLKKDIYN